MLLNERPSNKYNVRNSYNSIRLKFLDRQRKCRTQLAYFCLHIAIDGLKEGYEILFIFMGDDISFNSEINL